MTALVYQTLMKMLIWRSEAIPRVFFPKSLLGGGKQSKLIALSTNSKLGFSTQTQTTQFVFSALTIRPTHISCAIYKEELCLTKQRTQRS